MRAAALMPLLVAAAVAGTPRKPDDLQRYIASVEAGAETQIDSPPGSLFSSGAPLSSLGLDIRARGLNDLLTILVQERASAVARGTTQSARQSNLKSSVGDLLGPASRALNRLGQLSTSTDLSGEGTTTRETILNTSITVRVVHVLPNGDLVVEGEKRVTVNSEAQTIVLRGVVRPADIASGNFVVSNKVGSLEVKVNGKGVVGDAVRRPFFLYRLLLGILPF
ncbi:MAG TPA: flagellar basal body L-ring protein FlgH [Bryobacteraceae bacterium]|nr:flagellar basal body L-ring protein FlgH [Bryobacteraceae bacterium]